MLVNEMNAKMAEAQDEARRVLGTDYQRNVSVWRTYIREYADANGCDHQAAVEIIAGRLNDMAPEDGLSMLCLQAAYADILDKAGVTP